MIKGKLVSIRPVEEADLTALKAVNDDPIVRGNVVGWGWPVSLDEQSAWFARQGSSESTQRWVVVDGEDAVIGLTGLWDIDLHNRNALTALKLGGTHPDVRGRGLGTDAIKAVMAFAFYDVGLERLYSTILEDNGASRRAYCDHCGWAVEGVARRHVWRHGGFKDLLSVGILKSDFDQLPDAEDYVDLIRTGGAV